MKPKHTINTFTLDARLLRRLVVLLLLYTLLVVMMTAQANPEARDRLSHWVGQISVSGQGRALPADQPQRNTLQK